MSAHEKTILVVDDEEALRTLAAKLLAKRGYTVLTAASGDEALSALNGDNDVDLLVLDVMMPGRSGLDTLREIRERGCTVPVVLLTAQSKDEHILSGYKQGADCYITKPLQPKQLLNVVDYLVGDLSPAERAQLEPLL